MFWAPWTLIPLNAAQIAAFVVMGMGSLIALTLILVRMGRAIVPALEDGHTIALTAALTLTSRFILRDLTETGPNLFLWTLVWGGILLWLGGRRVVGGVLVGVATALKMTPAIFIPYFLLKREWRIAAVTLATAATLTALPALFQSHPVFWQEMSLWGENVWRGMTGLDPSGTILDKPTVANLSLRPALARFLQRYPAGHALFLDSPGFVQFFDLSPWLAGWLVRSTMLALLLLVGWRFRGRASAEKHPMILPLELAAISALALLYSPITWKQHCVSLLPALFFLACCSLQWDRVSKWMWCAAAYYLLFGLVLTRDVVGRDVSLLLESYHVVTWAVLLVVILLLVWHRRLSFPGPAK
jgi:alpha-1,2-mannosyltransferase